MEMAGTRLDLDDDLEPAGIEHILNQTPGWRSIIVVPISTSSSQGKRGPTVIELSGGTIGLAKTSYAVCHQVTTLDRAALTKRLGTLPSESLREVEEGLKPPWISIDPCSWPTVLSANQNRRLDLELLGPR